MLISSQADKVSEQIIQSVISNFYSNDFEEIKNTREYFTQEAVSERGWYDLLGILVSLFDLYLENYSTDKPIIHIDRQDISGAERKGLYDEFMEISKLRNEKNRDVLYIRKRPTNTPGTRSGTTEDHWVVLYFFTNDKGQKSLLLVDTLYAENRLEQFKIDAKDFLEKEKYNLYISTTQIQQDKCSCGPIASEIARMLYFNHTSVKDLLSKIEVQKDNIELSCFLPVRESEQLFGSCLEDGTVNYGAQNEILRATDFRVAHFATALTFGMDNILSKLHNVLDGIDEHAQEDFENARQIVENIRSTFIGKPENVAFFNQEIERLCQKQIPALAERRGENLSVKPEEAIPELQESLDGLKKSPHKSMNKEIKLREELIKNKTKKMQNKPKNIQYDKTAIYFIIAIALSALIITAAFLTQTYVILVALIIPAIIGLYGYNEGQKPDSKLQEDIEVIKSTVTDIEAGA